MAFEKTVKEVQYSTDQGTGWDPLGHVRQDGTEDNSEANAVETSAGVELYAGTNDEYVIMLPDMTKYSELATLMKDDSSQGTLWLKFIDAEGNEEVQEGFSVIVQKNKNFTPGDRNALMTRWSRFHV